jgi:hypothetical protein
MKFRFAVMTVLIITAVEYYEQNCHVCDTKCERVCLWTYASRTLLVLADAMKWKYLSWHIGIVCLPTNCRFVSVVLTAVGAQIQFLLSLTVNCVCVCTCAVRVSCWTFHKVRDKARMCVCVCVCVYILVYKPVYSLYIYVHTHTHTLEFERGNISPLPVENSGFVARQSTQLINAWIYENIPDSSIRSERKACLDDCLQCLCVLR